STQWKGLFPLNGDYDESVGHPVALWWCDEERIGPFVTAGAYYENNYKPPTNFARSGIIARSAVGGAFVCPDDEGAGRSYAMNLHASSRWFNTWNGWSNLKQQGDSPYLFRGPFVRERSKTILI